MRYKRPAKTVTATILSNELLAKFQLTGAHYLVEYTDGSQELMSEGAFYAEGYLPLGRRMAKPNGQAKPKPRPRLGKKKEPPATLPAPPAQIIEAEEES